MSRLLFLSIFKWDKVKGSLFFFGSCIQPGPSTTVDLMNLKIPFLGIMIKDIIIRQLLLNC